MLGSIAFFAAYAQGVLPARFALTTAVTDLAFGLTALFVGWKLVSKEGLPRRGFSHWHLVGMVALLVSSTIGILTSPTPLGILTPGVNSQAVTWFPLSLVPTFFGPVTMIAHVMALQIARARVRSRSSIAEARKHPPLAA